MSNLTSYKAIVLDLDNTIYNEIEYLKLAYQWISTRIISSDNLELQNKIYKFLVDEFIGNGRKDLYQKLKKLENLDEFSLDLFLDGLRTCPIDANSIEILSKYPMD